MSFLGMNAWLQTRRGFGIDFQVVNYMPFNLPVDLEIEGEDELQSCYGVFILSGYVLRLPFIQLFVGELT
jgi:hypothetical protein